VGGAQLEHHRFALLELDGLRHELELPRGNADDLLLRKGPDAEGARGDGEPRCQQQAPPRVHAQAFTTGNSLISYSALLSVSIPRKPRPLYGCAGSQATGTRLGWDPGA